MEKIEALNHVYATIETLCEKLQRQESLVEVGRLRQLQTELTAHRQMVELADLACMQGQAGTTPEGWEKWGNGQSYDPYEELVIAFNSLPGEGRLSRELLTYIEELPARLHREQDELLYRARTDTEFWLDNPLKKLTSKQVSDQLAKILAQQNDACSFSATYASDMAQARQVAETRGDFRLIRKLLA